MEYNQREMREYALLANIPVIFCLYYTNQHAILGKWIYQWLIDFAKNAKLAAFHPFTLRLVREKLPQWTNPLVGKSDYKLFLEGVFDPTRISDMEQMIDQAIRDDRVFFFNEVLGDWDLHSF